MRALDVARRIREIRQDLDLTQSQFAQRLGITKVSVARYEAGRIPKLEVLQDIAKLGEVTVAWMLDGPNKTSVQKEGSRPPDVNLSPAVRDFLAFLQQRIRAVATLPRQYRERYEERIYELSVLVKRELEEYQQLLEAEVRARNPKLGSRSKRGDAQSH